MFECRSPHLDSLSRMWIYTRHCLFPTIFENLSYSEKFIGSFKCDPINRDHPMPCLFDMWTYLLFSPDETDLSKNLQLLMVISKLLFISMANRDKKSWGAPFVPGSILVM